MPQLILVAEDNPKTRSSIQLYLENAGYQVCTAATGSDALDLARRLSPDLVILDVMLPHLSGLDVCQLLRAESQVPIVMLTARALEEDRVLGFDLGADDYVTKPFSPRELVRRVQAILRRAKQTDDKFQPPQRHGELVVDVTRHEVSLGGNPVALTATEFKLLKVMSESPGKVFTREGLVRHIFGNAYEGLERTIDTHVMNLRKKIERDPRHPSFVLTVYGVGYKFVDDVE